MIDYNLAIIIQMTLEEKINLYGLILSVQENQKKKKS